VLNALQRAGFEIHHVSGGHYVLRHPDAPSRRVTVAYHNKDLKRRTLESIVDQTGLSVDEFLRFLRSADSTPGPGADDFPSALIHNQALLQQQMTGYENGLCSHVLILLRRMDETVFPLLESYLWPGNARELRNAVERMAILTPGERLTRDSVPVEIRMQRETGVKSTIQEARESAEREHVLRALEESNWNVSGAARALGMERTNLHKRIRALGLSRGK
jgi:predicted RNA binding protein YcfA (HicA-like mRNA interferase family)